MIDGPSPIEPLLAEGPRTPMETLRPLVNFQRVLLLNGEAPRMVDLATGDIRLWENGPSVLVPCVSTPFDLSSYALIQVQVLRDPRPTSVDLTLFSMNLGGAAIDVVETTTRLLEIRSEAESSGLVSTAIGGSSAIVIMIEPFMLDGVSHMKVSARNAETVESIELSVPIHGSVAILTIGGPSSPITGAYGRRRLIPAHLDVAVRVEPVDQFRRVARKARLLVGSLRKKN